MNAFLSMQCLVLLLLCDQTACSFFPVIEARGLYIIATTGSNDFSHRQLALYLVRNHHAESNP